MTLTAAEQYFLELSNRARLDPLAEAARQGIGLNADLAPNTIGTGQLQVLAPNMMLSQAATDHSIWMFQNNQFSHTGENASSAGDRMRDAGYQFLGSWGLAENLAGLFSSAGIDLDAAVTTHFNGLYESAGHRKNTFSAKLTEVGIGQVAGTYNQSPGSIVTVNFAYSNNQTFVTGVSYRDTDGNGFYGIGEGLSGLDISVGDASARTQTAGGYSVAASARENLAVQVSHTATGVTDLTMDLRSGNGKLDVVQSKDGTWELNLSTSGNLQGGGITDATLLGVANLTLGGSAADNALTGNKSNNTIWGRDGNDTVSGGAGNDSLYGGSGNDLVQGGTGNDYLHDGWGADTMSGGSGADVFVMTADNTRDTISDFDAASDKIDLSSWEGEPVFEQTSYGMIISLGDEILRVYSANGQAIDPSSLNAGTIIGADIRLEPIQSSSTDLISEPDPVIEPEPTVPEPVTGATLQGGLGNNRFVINTAADVIVGEVGYSQGGGIDTVESWVDFTLPTNLEILRLQGSADINGTGGFAPEALVGQAGNNVLDGGGGNDVITAKTGDDTLIGGLGADSLVGNEGNDVFVFNAVADSRAGPDSRDFINGFTNGQDRIDLSAIDANTGLTGYQSFSFIGDSAFGSIAGELRYFTFGGGNFNIVEADVDGDGAADMQVFVNLTNEMFVSDFIL